MKLSEKNACLELPFVVNMTVMKTKNRGSGGIRTLFAMMRVRTHPPEPTDQDIQDSYCCMPCLGNKNK
ncbi:hypothetical protein A8C56_06890 [Niabella ginsenosidivorans]|uniref:Uncharacterized protein n=1 Tax=Niabella ginsenosidivorans TaxID=1176587 RepID=A0A1A9I0Z4_9BACT|nr:hypothetical protein A8C56_06890 [Niabella ginsenosidivorans]